MIRCILFTLLLALNFASGHSPAPTESDAFEVASIRPHQGPLHKLRELSIKGPVVTLEGYNRAMLVLEAYDLKDFQLSWLPAASGHDDIYYDIVAKADGEATPSKSQYRRMLQTLLAQRFNLKFHFATKQTAVYELTVERNGPKFKQSAPDASEMGRIGVHGRNQTIEIERESMNSLAEQLPNVFGVTRPVVDKTGLLGTFNIKLEATPEYRISNESASEDVSVFSALRDQLGLKLSPARADVQTLVVEHMESPSEN